MNFTELVAFYRKKGEIPFKQEPRDSVVARKAFISRDVLKLVKLAL